jgi:ATP-dependent Lon protease
MPPEEGRRMAGNEESSPDLPRTLEALPLFPLPGTVFFPGTLLPLHVFEPRYVQMTEDVLDGDRLMAVVLIQGEDARGDPPIYPVAGLGRVVHHEKLPDGRYHILLQGIARVRLVEELDGEGRKYRRAHAQVLPCEPGEPERVESELGTLRACYAQALDHCAVAREHLGDLPSRIEQPGVLADVICATVMENACTRQAALEDPSVVGRLQRASEALAEMLLGDMPTDDANLQ